MLTPLPSGRFSPSFEHHQVAAQGTGLVVKLNLLLGVGGQWVWMRCQRLGLGLSTHTTTGEQYKQAETGGAK
ncbi:hypothetical protein [Pseudomonas fluorescens]|uniref:hypothetical protein n=1 Tax=Pseudomonas fluorescens TaxID=294 RepID=UPI00178054DB|nr:hypothetical protein [Pseudomonas fluorescens]